MQLINAECLRRFAVPEDGPLAIGAATRIVSNPEHWLVSSPALLYRVCWSLEVCAARKSAVAEKVGSAAAHALHMAALEVSAYDDGHGLALRADFDKHAQKMVRMAGFNPFQGEPDIPMPRGEGLAEIAERAGRQAVIVMAADARHTWVSGGGGSWVGRQSEETVSAALTALMEAQIRLAELIASMSSSRQLSDMGTGPATNSAVLGLAAGEDAALAALDQAQFAASYMADQAEMARA